MGTKKCHYYLNTKRQKEREINLFSKEYEVGQPEIEDILDLCFASLLVFSFLLVLIQKQFTSCISSITPALLFIKFVARKQI